MRQSSKQLNKIMQLDAGDLEQSDKKECLLVIEKDPSPCPPTGGCESVSYHSTDFSKQRDYVDNDSNIAGYISMIMAYYRNPELMLRILYG